MLIAQRLTTLGNELVFDAKLIRERIRSVAVSEAELPEAVADDVAFHMTDWLEDLEAYQAFCAAPQSLTDEAVSKLLMQFLIHVPNHLAAASKLYMDIPVTDIFEVGSTTESE